TYLMINPAKASYSMAPTMVVCALAGFLTAKLFVSPQRHQVLLTILLGLLIGISVNFRLPNLFLSAGYFLFLLVCFARMRNKETLQQGVAFALAFLVGMAPTIFANAINARSPFVTAYRAVQVVPRDVGFGAILRYFGD